MQWAKCKSSPFNDVIMAPRYRGFNVFYNLFFQCNCKPCFQFQASLKREFKLLTIYYQTVTKLVWR